MSLREVSVNVHVFFCERLCVCVCVWGGGGWGGVGGGAAKGSHSLTTLSTIPVCAPSSPMPAGLRLPPHKVLNEGDLVVDTTSGRSGSSGTAYPASYRGRACVLKVWPWSTLPGHSPCCPLREAVTARRTHLMLLWLIFFVSTVIPGVPRAGPRR